MEFNLDAEFEALNNVLADLEIEGLSGKKTSAAPQSDSLIQQLRKIAESDEDEIVSLDAKVKNEIQPLQFLEYCTGTKTQNSIRQ